MSTEPINISRFENNGCFGCGHANARGLKIRLFSAEPSAQEATLVEGEFVPDAHQDGFPGITHGGVLYTAMDCASTWTAYIAKPQIPAIWVLRNAEMTYHHPAFSDTPIRLQGRLLEDAEDWQAIIVGVRALQSNGAKLAEGRFKVIPLSIEKFQTVTGVTTLPGNFADFLHSLQANR